MTSLEHAMLGMTGVLAAGWHRRWGWQLAALAAVAAAAPDWDGLPIVFSVAVFTETHRVWGHNLLTCFVLGLALGAIDYRWDLVTRAARALVRFLPRDVDPAQLTVRGEFGWQGLSVWLLCAVLAMLSHLPADGLVSGAANLNDWEIQPFWPISTRGWVYPLVPWGDVGLTLIFFAGMFAMLRWRSRVQHLACLTLLLVAVYLGLRGLLPA